MASFLYLDYQNTLPVMEWSWKAVLFSADIVVGYVVEDKIKQKNPSVPSNYNLKNILAIGRIPKTGSFYYTHHVHPCKFILRTNYNANRYLLYVDTL